MTKSNLNNKPSFFDKLKASFNLVIADAKRIKLDVFMIIIAGIGTLSILGMCGMFKLVVLVMKYTAESDIMAEEYKMINQLMSYLSFGISMSYYVLGFFIIAAIAIFSGRDFGYKTIRYKIHAGNSRTKIFLSTFLVNMLIGLTFYAVAAGGITLLNFLLFGVHFYGGALFVTTLLGFLPYAATIAIATFITMSTRSQILSILLNVGIAYIVPQITLIVNMLFSNEIAQNIIGSIPYQTINDLFFNIFSLDNVAMIGSDAIVPFPSLTMVLRASIASTIIIVASLIGGLTIFKRADLN